METPQDGLTTVFGAQNPLSNHFPCTIKVMGHTFASSEHAYLHTKARYSTKPELAQTVKDATSAAEAKRISKDVPFNPEWLSKREEIMSTVLTAKLQQVPAFSEALVESGESLLVGAAPGDFDWGSGLSERHTKTTIQSKWPGRNLLGKILMKLRDEAMKPASSDGHLSKTQTTTKPDNRRSERRRQTPN